MGASYDVLLAGIGIGGPANTTLGTIELLREARVALSLSVHTAWLREICPEVRHLGEEYFTGEEDARVYRRIAREVLREAERGPGVALVDDGHPLIFDDVCNQVLRGGRRRGLRVLCPPAVSCLDTLVSDCGVRMDATGLQIVEATTLVGLRQRLNPGFDTLVLQIGWFGTSLLVPIESHRSTRFDSLQRYLLRFYPRDHRVRILRARQAGEEPEPAAAGGGDVAADRPAVACRLDRLARMHRRIAVDSTLHVPALEQASDVDQRFMERTVDLSNLERIAQVSFPHARRASQKRVGGR